MSVVCVVGSFMMDLVASAPRRPRPGETLVGTDFSTYLGGKGFNQAIAAQRAGARTNMIGRLGDDDFGQAFRATLSSEGVNHSGVVLDPELGTGVGLPVVEPDGQNSIIVVPRANLAVDAEQVRECRDLIESADVLLLQLEVPVAAAVEASRIAQRAGARVVLNPAPHAPIADELREHVDVLVPNEVELLAFAEMGSHDDIDVAAKKVHEQWGTDVVVTLGAAGALVLGAAGEPVRLRPHAVTAVDSIGAGDIFCAYLGAGLAAGASLVEAAGLANAAGALAVTRRGGAQSAPLREDVERFLTGSRDDPVGADTAVLVKARVQP